ncbi:MAG: helix-turn-helix domain-containing protein [Candidatus Aenigmatarchaeota archaeon]
MNRLVDYQLIIRIASALVTLDKPSSFGELLKITGMARQSLTDYLKLMLNQRLIYAKEDPVDKRKVLYYLNENELCIIAIDEIMNKIKFELDKCGENLTEEEENLIRRILVEEIRPSLIEDLKRNEPILDPAHHILRYLTAYTSDLNRAISEDEKKYAILSFAIKWFKTDFVKKYFFDRFRQRFTLDLGDFIDLKRGVELNAFLSKKSKLLLDLMLKNGELEVRDGFVFLTDKGVERVVERMKREIERLLVNLNLLGVDVDKLCDEVVRKAKNTIIFRETFERKNASE